MPYHELRNRLSSVSRRIGSLIRLTSVLDRGGWEWTLEHLLTTPEGAAWEATLDPLLATRPDLDFLAWVRDDYDEAGLRRDFQSRAWADALMDRVLRRE